MAGIHSDGLRPLIQNSTVFLTQNCSGLVSNPSTGQPGQATPLLGPASAAVIRGLGSLMSSIPAESNPAEPPLHCHPALTGWTL